MRQVSSDTGKQVIFPFFLLFHIILRHCRGLVLLRVYHRTQCLADTQYSICSYCFSFISQGIFSLSLLPCGSADCPSLRLFIQSTRNQCAVKPVRPATSARQRDHRGRRTRRRRRRRREEKKRSESQMLKSGDKSQRPNAPACVRATERVWVLDKCAEIQQGAKQTVIQVIKPHLIKCNSRIHWLCATGENI